MAFRSSQITIDRDFVITGNSAVYGGGLSHNSSKPVVVNENAVIANNKATGEVQIFHIMHERAVRLA